MNGTKALILEGPAVAAIERLAASAGVTPAELIQRALRREDEAQRQEARTDALAEDIVAEAMSWARRVPGPSGEALDTAEAWLSIMPCLDAGSREHTEDNA